MNDVILIIASGNDRSVEPVIRELERMGREFFRLNTETFPYSTSVTIESVGSNIRGTIDSQGAAIALQRIRSCWYRHVAPAEQFSGVAEGYLRFIREETKRALWSLYTSLDVFWMNPPLVGSRLLGDNKLFQIKTAASVGLKTPETIITNDPERLIDFCGRCGGKIAVKLLSGRVFLREGENDMLCIYTQPISEEELRNNQEGIRLAPVLAQRYIAKNVELRITIVGRKIFACAIHSQDSCQTMHDWRRYDFATVKHEAIRLPVEIEAKLLKLMAVWGLQFGAIDMILTPEDEYVFLEVNPQGQWGWIQELTSMPISQAIAETLSHPPRRE